MGRVQSQHARVAEQETAADRHRKQLTNTSKPSYKVVLEQVTQQKRKLKSVDSVGLKPPAGYTFIAAGDPQLTAKCKELARLDGATVYTVSTSKFSQKISDHTHRVGYHFPSAVVGRACMSLGIDLSQSGHVLHRHELWPKERPRALQIVEKNVQEPQISQHELDKQAKAAILDLFPAIPRNDVEDIVNHAFELGTDRVGVQTSELSLPRRAQLAVVAHIRHIYTDYDKLLRKVPWLSARQLIEEKTLEKLVQWRGENNDEPDVMEDILREVIVIPEDDGPEETVNSLAKAQANDMESQRATPTEMMEHTLVTKTIDYGAKDAKDRQESPELGEVEDARFIGHGQYIIDRQDQGRIERDGARRLRAWEDARDRLRRPQAEPQVVEILSPPRARELEPSRTIRHGLSNQEPGSRSRFVGEPLSSALVRHTNEMDTSRVVLCKPFHEETRPKSPPTKDYQIEAFQPAAFQRALYPQNVQTNGREFPRKGMTVEGSYTKPHQAVSYIHIPGRNQQEQDHSSDSHTYKTILPSIETPRSTRFHEIGPEDRQGEVIMIKSPRDRYKDERAPLHVQREAPDDVYESNKRRKTELKDGAVSRYERHEKRPVICDPAAHEVPLTRNYTSREVQHEYLQLDNQRREPPRSDYRYVLSEGRNAGHPQILLFPKQGHPDELSRVSSVFTIPRSHQTTARDLSGRGGPYVSEVKALGHGVSPSYSTMPTGRPIHEHGLNYALKRSGDSGRPAYMVDSPTEGASLRNALNRPNIEPETSHTGYTKTRDNELKRMKPSRVRRTLPLDVPHASLVPLPEHGRSNQSERTMIVRVGDEHQRSNPFEDSLGSREFRSSGWTDKYGRVYPTASENPSSLTTFQPTRMETATLIHGRNSFDVGTRIIPREAGPRRMYDARTGQEIIVIEG